MAKKISGCQRRHGYLSEEESLMWNGRAGEIRDTILAAEPEPQTCTAWTVAGRCRSNGIFVLGLSPASCFSFLAGIPDMAPRHCP